MWGWPYMDYSYLLRHFVFPTHAGLARLKLNMIKNVFDIPHTLRLARSDPDLLKILYVILHFMEFLLKAPIGAFFLFLI